MNTYWDLMNFLSPDIIDFMPELEDASWSFVSYMSVRPDTFVLVGKVNDSNRTPITVTSLVPIQP